ncbi:ABC-type branched-subunit amino acid transport system permease subunit [Mesorhizobium sp. USDA 4775]
MYRLTTRTRAGTATEIAVFVLVLAGLALPAVTSRGVIQDLFFILTMLTLAQIWNLLAGYGGLISVGQQAFVGIGAYAMFAGVILLGWNPVAAILLGGLAALALAVPTAFFAFRLQGAYFAIGTWVIAEVTRLLIAQWKALGGGTGTSLPREATSNIMGTDAIQALFGVREAAARDILAYWLALALVVVVTGCIYWLLRSRLGLALAAVRDNVEAAQSVGVDVGRSNGRCF